MSLIRSGYAGMGHGFGSVVRRLALALFDSGVATAHEVKQIKLTEKQIQGFITAHKEIVQFTMARRLTNRCEDGGAGRDCCEEERICQPR